MHIMRAKTKTGISGLVLAIAMIALFPTNARAQYTVTDLVSNQQKLRLFKILTWLTGGA